MTSLLRFVISACCLCCITNSQSQDAWDKIEVIRSAAVEIRAIQREQGNLKALADIDECYSRVMRPTLNYSREVEVCLAKDFTIATISAAFYKQLSEAGRQANNVDHKTTFDSMRRRIASTFQFFGVPSSDAAAYGKLLVENALQAVLEVEKSP